jgi:hypothetical protein
MRRWKDCLEQRISSAINIMCIYDTVLQKAVGRAQTRGMLSANVLLGDFLPTDTPVTLLSMANARSTDDSAKAIFFCPQTDWRQKNSWSARIPPIRPTRI